MKHTFKDRIRRIFRLPIGLLMPALIVGFAAVGQAQGIPEMVITAERPAECETSVDLRDQMQVTARRAVWKTQVRVGADLSMKLNNRSDWIRLASTGDRKTG
jgi:hypothetical protein